LRGAHPASGPRAPREKGFAELVRQAQDIVDKLPAK
jgi:hypothetical protein